MNETPSQQPRQVIFVLGMHRSGTSALTRVLNLLGYSLPENLLPANDANRKGFWEPLDMMRLNQRILDAADRLWYDPKPVDLKGLMSSQSDEFIQQAAEFLDAETSHAVPSVLKDPRLSRTLPIWLRGAEQVGITPMALMARRNPVEVAASLQARDGMDLQHGMHLWLSYMLESEINCRDVSRYLIEFDDLIEDWRGTLDEAAAALKLKPPSHAGETGALIDGFLDPGERHFENDTSGNTLDLEGGLPLAALDAQFCSDHSLSQIAAYDDIRARWASFWASKSPGGGRSTYALKLPEGFLRESRFSRDAGDDQNELSSLQAGVGQFPEHADLRIALGRTLMRNKRADEAVEHIRRAVELVPDRAGFQISLAQALSASGDVEAGLQAALQASHIAPDNPAIVTQLGMQYVRNGRFADAQRSFERAIELKADHAPAHHGLSLAAERQGHLAEALEAATIAAKLSPDNAGLNVRLENLRRRLAD
ncbi:tetratricopeptide repeat protein [Henriciella sp. AS95]|uniref:tetratricopeptide repeat protein n=1 Tax=Henriciella sp. AS95 TaxID=3135782 RepID=UPI00317901C0